VPDSGGLRLELFVRDVPRSVAFYRDVLGFVAERESAGYVPMSRGAARIALGAAADLPTQHYFRPDVSSTRPGAGVEIVLEVDDVADEYARLVARGHAVLSPLRQQPWGLTDFRLADPDGYYIRVTSRG